MKKPVYYYANGKKGSWEDFPELWNIVNEKLTRENSTKWDLTYSDMVEIKRRLKEIDLNDGEWLISIKDCIHHSIQRTEKLTENFKKEGLEPLYSKSSIENDKRKLETIKYYESENQISKFYHFDFIYWFHRMPGYYIPLWYKLAHNEFHHNAMIYLSQGSYVYLYLDDRHEKEFVVVEDKNEDEFVVVE